MNTIHQNKRFVYYLLQDQMEFKDYDGILKKIDSNLIEQKGDIIKVKFVGLYNVDKYVFFSFPKNYIKKSIFNSKLLTYEELHLLNLVKPMINVLDTLNIYEKSIGYNTSDLTKNFPYEAIYEITEYYIKYGLYKEQRKDVYTATSGNINWKKSIRSKNVIISDFNIIYSPLVVNKKERKSVFLTECMSYALSEINEVTSLYRPINYTEHITYDKYKFENNSLIVYMLQECLRVTFKDIDVNLIKNLISFFEYKSNYYNSIKKFYTINYRVIWEKAVEKYLNEYMCGIGNDYDLKLKKSSKQSEIKFYLYTFNPSFDVNQRLECKIDHYFESNEVCYIFDSKYYEKPSTLDYKQCSYYYFIKSNLKNKEIYNGLIFPTLEKSKKTVHIDRKNIDGLVIYNYFLNSHDVLTNYIKR